MIESLLIANRGEIARRIIRTARAMGARTVAVYSEADAEAPHVREADEAVAIGPAPAAESYLNAARILEAARASGAAAIHPGYGFLSENADFAEAVIASGLIWVGPPPAAIRAMGRKDAAKRLMAEAGVPVTPGYLGDDQDEARLAAEAETIGWPVMIKAVAGGGGKGMRKVDTAEAFAPALASARREAASAFGDDRVLLEKFVSGPRHIEVQVFADAHGNVIHLFERDCSLQRRHQKVVEEAPAPGMDATTREAICTAAVLAARAVGYQGAGTVEFIADGSEGLRADRIWFMEMNTRLQVEHPVTEEVTGLDLVEWQLRVAAGEPLPLRQDEIALSGAAIEARLYAEDPGKAFLPSTGRLTHFRLPSDLRVDSAVEEGGAVTPYYDPMIAKLIAHAETRDEAVRRLADACAAVEVWPVKTNAGFLARLLNEAEVRKGGADTGFIERAGDRLMARPAPSAELLAAAAALTASSSAAKSPWSELIGFRLNAPNHRTIQLEYEQIVYNVEPVLDLSLPGFATRDGAVVFMAGEAYAFSAPRAASEDADGAGDGAVRAPMPGKIVAVHAATGERVTKGRPLVTLEAMKMEHGLAAPFDGVISEVFAQVGDQVTEGAVLARVEVRVSKK